MRGRDREGACKTSAVFGGARPPPPPPPGGGGPPPGRGGAAGGGGGGAPPQASRGAPRGDDSNWIGIDHTRTTSLPITSRFASALSAAGVSASG